MFTSFKFTEDEGVGSPLIDSKSIADILNKSSSFLSIILLTSFFYCFVRSENLFSTGKKD